MIWSLIKIFVFLGLAVAAAFGVAWIVNTPGEITVAFAGHEWFLSPIGFLIAIAVILVAAWILLKILGLVIAVFRFLLGDETALTRYFDRSRERRGFNALSDGLIAIASGDSKLAAKKAAKADKLLNRPDVTAVISAQAAEMNGDRTRALQHYKRMLDDDRTRFAGIKGLMKQQLEDGNTEKALALAKKGFAIQPNNPELLTSLFDMQSKQADWAGARDTLNASVHTRLLPRDVGTRRDAVLSLADARAAAAAGNIPRRNDAALQAVKLAPTLIPAATLAAEVHTENGAKRKAKAILVKAWSNMPHPEIAAAFAAIEPTETPEARRKRFATLTAAAPSHPESRLLNAELALAAEDFPAARKALGDLAETDPTTRSLAVMAAIERGQGAPENVVRGWLTKALTAPRGPQWICEKCNDVHSSWSPVCENCGAFDTLAWKSAPHKADAGYDHSAMLPMLVGRNEARTSETEEDADVTIDGTADDASTGAEQARA